jgi:fatty acid desaturase
MTTTGVETRYRSADFADLRRLIKDAGLLAPRHGAYLCNATVVVMALAGCWAAFGVLGESWWQLLVAALLGLVFTQLGFLGHDAGHHQVMRGGHASAAIGLLAGNLAIGLGHRWWNDKHNAHHAHPNDLARDPDVGIGALVFDGAQASGRQGLARFVTRWQAVLFLPMLLLEGVSLHISSLRSIRARTGAVRWLELGLLAVHVIGYVGVVLWFLPPGQALAFMAVHQAVFGLYLGLSFAPNHKGMPLLSEVDATDHLRTQVLTSRNVRPGRILDVALGGLNYQIEHHLFPSMPRHNLRAAQPLVQAFCASRGVAYLETGLLRSYGQALAYLHRVGAPLRMSAT